MSDISTSYLPNQEGATFADKQAVENLRLIFGNLLFDGDKRPETVSAGELIPGYTSALSNIPIRTATNAIEHYGGMRMDGIAGPGDVVCRTEDMEKVSAAILDSRRQRVRDILALVSSCPDDFVVDFDSHIVDRFLELYDQPLPDAKIFPLNLPAPQTKYRDTLGHAQFEYDGIRDKVWAEGPVLSQIRMEGDYAYEQFKEWKKEYHGRRNKTIQGNVENAKKYCQEYSRGYSIED